MKILYQHRTSAADGQYVHISELTRALKAQGHELQFVGPGRTARREVSLESSAGRLRRILPKALYELLELSYSAMAFARIWRAYRTFRPDAYYERHNLLFLAGVWLKKLTGVPMLLEVNAPLYEERAKYDGMAWPRLGRWTEEAVWRAADYVLPVTEVLAGYVAAAGVPRERIVVIPNGVSDAFLNPAPSDKRAELDLADKLVLGFTGFIRPWHGLEEVIDFLASDEARPDLHLLVVGDGPARPALQRRARERGVEARVTFAGIVPREDIPGLVAAFDVALQPRATSYASPLKLFEYMALGRAIVAPDSANIREVLVDGENAVLFEADDASALRRAVMRVVDDAELRRRIAAGARRTIDERDLTWAGNARRVAALARAVIDRRSGG